MDKGKVSNANTNIARIAFTQMENRSEYRETFRQRTQFRQLAGMVANSQTAMNVSHRTQIQAHTRTMYSLIQFSLIFYVQFYGRKYLSAAKAHFPEN